MIVAALRLTFMVAPDGSSHKSAAQKIKERLWSHFKVAVAEISHNSPAELRIGLSFVGTQESDMELRVQEIVRHMNDWNSVEMTYDESELIHFDDLELERDYLKYDP